MKRIAIITLILAIAVGLCGCKMGGNEQTTSPTNNTTVPQTTAPTEPPVTTPIVTDPIVIEPTIEPNIPDPSVDNDHLIDSTEPENGSNP